MLGLKGVLTKLLVTGTSLVLISGCSTNTISTADNYKEPKSLIGLIFNLGKYHWYSLDDEAMSKHQSCVTTSLNYSSFGRECHWSTQTVKGIVTVADVYQAGGRICKVLRTSIKDTSDKTFVNTQRACGNGNNWKFIRS